MKRVKPKMASEVRLKKDQKIVVTIKRLGINGEGIGYYKRKIVFIPKALPGEVVLASVTEAKEKYAKARLLKIKQESPARVQPVDKYDVGGIELEHLAYPAQLEFKQDVIAQALAKYRPAGYKEYELRPTLGMADPYHYRNKAQFQVRKNKAGQVIAGLYKENSHILVDLPTFATQRDLTMKVINTVRKLLEKWQVSIYDERKDQGAVKTLVVRESFATKEVQLVFITRTAQLHRKNEMLTEIKQLLPEVVSVMQNINPQKTSLIWGEETQLLMGKESITERLGDVSFELSARAFFQMNPLQTKVLYDEVKKALELSPNETLVDAYCGVGTIGLYVGKEAKEIRGMDIVAEAVADAKINAKKAGRNAIYTTGKAETVILKWLKEGFSFDALVVDPPRTGLDEALIKAILKYRPAKFVYVSCNPSTLARDLVALTKAYRVEYIRSVDMFPQTARVEAVVKLVRRV